MRAKGPGSNPMLPVAINEIDRRARYEPATSFWNLGLLRSGSKLGSIFSQPGEKT